MEKVTRYKASDGVLFINSYECEIYERNIEAAEKLEKLYDLKDAEIKTASSFAYFVLNNKEEIIKILIENMKL